MKCEKIGNASLDSRVKYCCRAFAWQSAKDAYGHGITGLRNVLYDIVYTTNSGEPIRS